MITQPERIARSPYRVEPAAFAVRPLDANCHLAVSASGDFAFLTQAEIDTLRSAPNALPVERVAELKAKFLLRTPNAPGMDRLLASRRLTRHETVAAGPSLHILVPTLRCDHSCRYCQVSRALCDDGFTMTLEHLDAACEAVFQSASPTLTVEFQGGDPLLRFDLVRRAIERISALNQAARRRIRFVVASTLHQLDGEMCAFFKDHQVYLSTSIDGPAWLHNRNRPLPTRDAYERTVDGIRRAREQVAPNAVSALMTTTRDSLRCPEDIVDTYVELGLEDVFIRSLGCFGFARRNQRVLAYSLEEFQQFYVRAFARVLEWNRRGVPLREVSASIALNKMLSPFDAGYVDLQQPLGAGLAVLVYNYDGYVYPSDEARMLAECGDTSLRLGRIGDPITALHTSGAQRALLAYCDAGRRQACDACAYGRYCNPDPVSAYNHTGHFSTEVLDTEHCRQHLWLFDFLFRALSRGDPWFEDLAHRWAQPVSDTTLERHADRAGP